MAIRGVLKSNEPILHEKAREVTEFNQKLWILLDDMKETMLFEEGVGLAAPQIGILKRVCVVSPGGEQFIELINPVIEKADGTQTCVEGCLSIEGVRGRVIRPKFITVRAHDRFGAVTVYEAEDFLADVFCHEIDHLDGILFTDRMTSIVTGAEEIKTLKGVRKSSRKPNDKTNDGTNCKN